MMVGTPGVFALSLFTSLRFRGCVLAKGALIVSAAELAFFLSLVVLSVAVR
jgi:hypothetical protein